MVETLEILPDDVGALKELLRSKNQLLRDKDQYIALLEEERRLRYHQRFAPKSEKISKDQFDLFNEAELEAENGTLRKGCRRPQFLRARSRAANRCRTTFHAPVLSMIFPKKKSNAPAAAGRRVLVRKRLSS